MGVVNYPAITMQLALPITCRGIFTMLVAFEQAFMVTLSLLAFLPLADYSNFTLVSSPLAAATRRAMNIKQFCITCAGLLLAFINNEYSYFAVQIIEDLDNRSSDNRGSTVYMYVCKYVCTYVCTCM